MAQIILSDEAYQRLMDAATARGMTPEEVILDALDHQRAHPNHALTAEEFIHELGFTPEEAEEALREAEYTHPELYPPQP